jgi:hypothetical protein
VRTNLARRPLRRQSPFPSAAESQHDPGADEHAPRGHSSKTPAALMEARPASPGVTSDQEDPAVEPDGPWPVPTRPSFSAVSSRIWILRILPVTVIGNSSTSNT